MVYFCFWNSLGADISALNKAQSTHGSGDIGAE
jgi:hypothetical protein